LLDGACECGTPSEGIDKVCICGGVFSMRARFHGKEEKMKKQNKKQQGYTLLEYCAGAAIIAGILWTALNTMSTNMSTLLTNVGTWATSRANTVVTK